MFLLHAPTGGGAQRRTLQLAGALPASAELVFVEAGGALAGEVPTGVSVSVLPSGLARLPWVRSSRIRQMAVAIPALAERLRRDPPDVLVAAANHVHLAALCAHALAGRPCRLVLRVSNHLAGGKRGQPVFDWTKRRAAAFYTRADAAVAVSDDIAAQLRGLAPTANVRVLPNPVVDVSFPARMAAPVDHPWLNGSVVLGVGRLERQKDFPTLVRAAGRLGARLIILGEGGERPRLKHLARSLGVELEMPGFVPDPLPWMARASAFALSSAWEGLPGALIEAMACGCPVVATDCPGGAAELLDHGRLGPLVPVGDDAAMAEALGTVIDRPPDREALRRRAAAFSVDASARTYADLFTELCARGATTR